MAPVPQPFGLQLKVDQKQHQHNAELGKVKNVLYVGDQPQAPRANANTRSEVANDGAQAELFGDGHCDDGSG